MSYLDTVTSWGLTSAQRKHKTLAKPQGIDVSKYNFTSSAWHMRYQAHTHCVPQRFIQHNTDKPACHRGFSPWIWGVNGQTTPKWPTLCPKLFISPAPHRGSQTMRRLWGQTGCPFRAPQQADVLRLQMWRLMRVSTLPSENLPTGGVPRAQQLVWLVWLKMIEIIVKLKECHLWAKASCRTFHVQSQQPSNLSHTHTHCLWNVINRPLTSKKWRQLDFPMPLSLAATLATRLLPLHFITGLLGSGLPGV